MNQLQIQLSPNLVLRRSRRADAQRLGQFYTTVFKDENDEPEMSFIPWVRDFLSGEHPTFGEGDFTIVEDTRSGQIVSAMNLISQTWTYAGIPIPVGRPEAVATAPEYRNQGLVRTQFEVVHAWSRERGELLQGITGIPFYYRQFGYEMCIDLEGGRIGYPGSLPAPTQAQREHYSIRPAQAQDIPFLVRLHRQACSRLLVTCPRGEALWHYELFGYSPGVDDARMIRIIEANGEPLGYLLHPHSLGPDYLDASVLRCVGYELVQGASYLDVTPVVLDYLLQTGQQYTKESNACKGIGFFFEEDHPAMAVAARWLPNRKLPYAWYIRVPDLPAFLRKITPVLEQHLETSCCAGYSGVLSISFYNRKLSLIFEKGKILDVQQVPFYGEEGCQAAFPEQTFLHLVFGYRTLEEVEHIYADCWAEDTVRPLILALFPKQSSNIWPVS
jgi:hypothetical protein